MCTASQCDLRDPGWGDPGFRHCDFFALAPYGPSSVFFSVRRLLGSRQVVTQCFCHLNELCSIVCPALGSQKRAWTSTQSNMSKLGCTPGNRKETENKQTRPHNNKNQKPTKTNTNHTAVMEELYKQDSFVPMN